MRRAHGATYRVFMLGFVPGFAYLGIVDERIAMPRHATPRVRVPVGSVGIAGVQTGIYPTETPGGWQLIGRTPIKPFDRRSRGAVSPEGRRRGAVLRRSIAIGSSVSELVRRRPDRVRRRHERLRVIRGGMLTTIQDSGRWGFQSRGVPVAGPMDPVSHRLANALVGNDASAATLEVTLLGPELSSRTSGWSR